MWTGRHHRRNKGEWWAWLVLLIIKHNTCNITLKLFQKNSLVKVGDITKFFGNQFEKSVRETITLKDMYQFEESVRERITLKDVFGLVITYLVGQFGINCWSVFISENLEIAPWQQGQFQNFQKSPGWFITKIRWIKHVNNGWSHQTKKLKLVQFNGGQLQINHRVITKQRVIIKQLR